MIRDYDRNETELRDLRRTADILDGGLRRFASGDIRTTLDEPLPLRFEGLRRDFNRGIATVGRTIGTVSANVDTMRADSETMASILRTQAQARQDQADRITRARSKTTAHERSAKQRQAITRHVGTIAHNTQLDMRRPKEAVAAALKLIETMELSGGNTSETGISAIRAKTEEIERELRAIGLYVDALAQNVEELTQSADAQAAEAETIRCELDEMAKAKDAQATETLSTSHVLDSLNRSIGEIDRAAARYSDVTILPAAPIFPPEGPHPPSGGRKPFLRLIKT
jgi:methyl-accepting chemotaxis protein